MILKLKKWMENKGREREQWEVKSELWMNAIGEVSIVTIVLAQYCTGSCDFQTKLKLTLGF